MIKLLPLLLRESKLVPLRQQQRKDANIERANRLVQDYIDGGSKGRLDLSGTPITSLPQGLKVGGYLNLVTTEITSLPSDIQVDGTLNISATKITTIPPNLKVGSLIAYNTPISSLPQGLKIDEDLYLVHSNITSLPSDIQVGGNVYLSNTPISEKYTTKQIRKMCPGIKGRIYIK